jgi:hypothetical protein
MTTTGNLHQCNPQNWMNQSLNSAFLYGQNLTKFLQSSKFFRHYWIMKACLPFAFFSTGDTPRIALILRCKQIQETPPPKKTRKWYIELLRYIECVWKDRHSNNGSFLVVTTWLSAGWSAGLGWLKTGDENFEQLFLSEPSLQREPLRPSFCWDIKFTSLHILVKGESLRLMRRRSFYKKKLQ